MYLATHAALSNTWLQLNLQPALMGLSTQKEDQHIIQFKSIDSRETHSCRLQCTANENKVFLRVCAS